MKKKLCEAKKVKIKMTGVDATFDIFSGYLGLFTHYILRLSHADKRWRLREDQFMKVQTFNPDMST